VRVGMPGGAMPPIALPEAEVEAVASHVRSLAQGARQPRTWPRVLATLPDGTRVDGLVLAESSTDLHVLRDDGSVSAVARRGATLAMLPRAPMPTLTPRPSPPAPGPGDWVTYNGDPGGNRHTELNQITPANVPTLRPAWTFAVPGGRALRSTPLVMDGVMYVGAPNEVYALDARSGKQIWQYRRPRTQGVIGDAGAAVNRGVALHGDRLFMVTDDARIVALHRGNGQVLWDVVMADYRKHYGATSAPLVVGDRVISGVSGGDEGIRGFVAAFDVASGRELWRFWTVPAPGEAAADTWKGRALEHGCAATWLTGSYDAELDTVYWTAGNPCPDYNGEERVGDNLWSNSILALDPATGRLRWHFQFTPHDLHDWDSVQTVVAVDATFRGSPRKLLLQANRNGFFYVLDRESGRLLSATPFIKNLNWATGVGADGRPQRIAGMEPSWRGTTVCPSVVGATNWMAPAFNPATGLYYVMALERCTIFQKSSRWFEQGESFYGGSTRNVPGETGGKVLRAIDIDTGRIAWEMPQVGEGDSWGGVLSTATGLLFVGEDDGTFSAVDARTGVRQWQFAANALWRGSPMTYLAGGRQHVAVTGGAVVYAFALPN
jgi:alcohol dehydrogenase (cytochrome c)